ncbi:FMN-binding protein [Gimesia panareensis]|uniref:4Fe-4S binding domain protein n=1 Tax=Gimesia panareensis TaxID=2527978 RepID=A0A518A8H1_9PLAN|nr:4Fe-4S binding protein [Gimesia panareensis]QDT28160.1 4Fe-4S binding domain protein [Gimesia panareensis]QDU51027.1 4Fe-4S binding domain protein [Gimesia panareensis]
MTELPLASQPAPRPRPASQLRSFSLKLYRITILLLIVWLIRDYYIRIRVQGQAPIELREVKEILPQAEALSVDHSDRMGLFILDRNNQTIGYAIRTSPISDEIIGYCGPTDTLIVFGQKTGKVSGLAIRSSGDTTSHVNDVRANQYFRDRWKEYSWDQIAKLDLEQGEIEGVSGATMTSMGLAYAIRHRIRYSQKQAQAITPFRFEFKDTVLIMFATGACLLTFTRLKRIHWLRKLFKIAAFIYLGFITGDLLAESLFAGWAKYAVPWRQLSGLVLLAGTAILIPWSTRRNVYCQSLCPHGTAQEFLGRLIPHRKKWKIRPDVKRALRWIPGLLLALILIIIFLRLPVDLAELEAFDAYLLTSAGIASIVIALSGLIASIFVPQAYCHFGCPTGTIFEFVRSHGRADHFGKSDFVAGLFLIMALILNQYAEVIQQLLLQ